MADGHCFISYSNADGLLYASQLANELQGRYPNIKVWFDKSDLDAGEPWDTQIAEAIRSCKCLIFVMTDDSVAENSICRDEWTWALKYKKPIIPLHFHPAAELPFRLSNLQYIDFVRDFKIGMSQLRQRIIDLESPRGMLVELRHRLADAQRDFRRATHENKTRIQVEIGEITKQIDQLEEALNNPKSVARKTDLSIGMGIVEERKASKVVITHGATKVINRSAMFVPGYFQDRIDETKKLVDFIQNDTQVLTTIIGRGGIGKSALVYRLLNHLEKGVLPDNLGNFFVNGIVYLRETGGHEINFHNLFNDLSKLLIPDKAIEAESILRVANQSVESKMHAFLSLFNEGRYVILFDNFDELVDIETQDLRDRDLNSALQTLLLHECKAIKLIITTRKAPHKLNFFQPVRQQILPLEAGLSSPYAEDLLRALDSDGDLGLKSASDELLNKARGLTLGFPRALEALFGILAADRYTTLEDLIRMPLPQDIVNALVGEGFSRLDVAYQKTMQALAVFNRPVPPVSIDYLLQPIISGVDSKPLLDRLVEMHFAKRVGNRYYLHPSDQNYAFNLIPLNFVMAKSKNIDLNTAKYWNREFLLRRAGDYYQQVRQPPSNWKTLEDLSANLIEYEYRMATQDFDKAAQAINEACERDYLLRWGYYQLILDLHIPLIGKLKDTINIVKHKNALGNAYRFKGLIKQAIIQYEEIYSIPGAAARTNAIAITFTNLAECYEILGDYHHAIGYLNKALPLIRKTKDRLNEGPVLGSLGGAYYGLGELNKAIELNEQALKIVRDLRDRGSEVGCLDSLGSAYSAIGQLNKALELFEQELTISREIGSRLREAHSLRGLSLIQADFGRFDKAIELLEQALTVCQDMNDRRTKGFILISFSSIYTTIGQASNAINYAKESVSIATELGIPAAFEYCELVKAYIGLDDLFNACVMIEAALQYDEPINNHNTSVFQGIITLRQEDYDTAMQAFKRAITQADELLVKTPEYYDALDAKGLALCGLALIEGDSHLKDDCHLRAIETFHAARRIAPYSGIVKRYLQLFDELAKCDTEGILKDVRPAVEGKGPPSRPSP